MSLTVNNVAKSFGKVNVLQEVNLNLEKSDFKVIVGSSGSGKTTLLRLIAGLETPDRGEIFINGKKMSSPGYAFSPHKRNLGFVFQTSALWPHMTVEQNILFGLKGMPKKDAQQRLEELMDKISISYLKGRYPDEISGGEARRVALARSLAPQPLCLLMDEPLTNLDADLKDNLLYFIIDTLKESGTSLIYVTHDLREAEVITPRRLILKNGFLKENETGKEGGYGDCIRPGEEFGYWESHSWQR